MDLLGQKSDVVEGFFIIASPLLEPSRRGRM
jgi:hypothetical protein